MKLETSLIFLLVLMPNCLVFGGGLDLLDLTKIVPGTKWCGVGDNATSDNDLGINEAEDMCCREHDLQENMPVGTDLYGLHNFNGPFARTSCTADVRFKRCLLNVGTYLAQRIGESYFMNQKRCYQFDHRILKCLSREKKEFSNKTYSDRCVKYYLKFPSDKTYQFFELPIFSSTYGVEGIGSYIVEENEVKLNN